MTPLIPYFTAGGIEVLGVFTLHTHGLMLLAGVIVGWVVALRKARRDGLRADLISGFLPWLFVGLRVHAVDTNPGSNAWFSPSSNPAFLPSPLRERVGCSEQDQFRGYCNYFHSLSFRPALFLSTLRSGCYHPPTQDSIRGCWLGFTTVAISGH